MVNRKKFDFVLATLLLLLILCGSIAIFTASTSKLGDQITTMNYWWKHLIFTGLLIGLLILLLKVPLPIFEALVLPLYLLNLVALVLVLFTPPINNSHRWFVFYGFSYQPSESAKLLTILMASRMLAKEHLSDFRQLIYGLGIVLVPVLLIIMEPDLGTTLVFFTSLLAMYVAAGLPLFYVLLIISPVISILTSVYWLVLVIWIILLIYVLMRARLTWVVITVAVIINVFISLIMPVVWNSMKHYQQNRILTFIDPMRDPLGAGYQIIQSKIAIGSGAITGKGWLEGTQKNMNFLPEHHTDFIFSVIGEEFGFFGSMLVLLLFFLFFWRISIAIGEFKVRERKIVASGIFAWLMTQTFINMGMNIGLVPATGIPLPFISYGGSSLLINGLAVGVVLKYLNERGFMK